MSDLSEERIADLLRAIEAGIRSGAISPEAIEALVLRSRKQAILGAASALIDGKVKALPPRGED